jgi:16S rRNA (adenine1518-N6/adenine1519-N6)-dimethyltransferase
MLRNNLKSLLDGDRLMPILKDLQIEAQVRAEELSLSQWIDLSNQLESLLKTP